MQARTQISVTRKILYGIMLMVVFLSAFFSTGNNLPAASAQAAATDSPTQETQYSPLISSGLFLYASTILNFDTQTFLDQQNGPLKNYTEEINGQTWSAADSISYNAIYYGINPQVIITLLEAQNNTISKNDAQIPSRVSPFANETENTQTFYYHVKWLSELASSAFYLRRDIKDNGKIYFETDAVVDVPQDLNAGTYGIQTGLAKVLPYEQWLLWTAGTKPLFIQTYLKWFGNPTVETDKLASTDVLPSIPGNYNLPFPIGSTWYYTGGPHTYSGSGARPWSSIDLAPPEVTACSAGSTAYNSRWIVAARGGTVITSQTALIVIDHGDGWRTYYSHVSSTDRRGTGGVNQNDSLGHPSCEVEPGGSTSGIHVHFAIYQVGTGFVNITGSSFSEWVVSETTHYNGTMTRQGVTRTATTGRYNGTNDILNSGSGGSSCAGPSLNSPSDGYVSSSQTIAFSWSALSGCTFNGYTFRINDSSNMDDSPIIDTGEGGTSRTETIGTEWNNRDLWWGVKAANAPNGSSWSVRRFRIEPGSSGCNPNADQIALYIDPNYSGTCVIKGIGDYPNPSGIGIANDSISSVKVGSNVKLTLCRDDNYMGGCEEFTGDDSNLNDNSIGDNSASSAKVATRNTIPPGYIWCANEGGTCSFNGIGDVAYGANGMYNYRYGVNGSIACNNDTFGDPISGTSKACYYKITTSIDHPVQFYKDAQYQQGYCFGDSAGSYGNLDGCNGYDENISSILLNAGWSVRVFKERDLGGTSKCFTSNDDNFSNDTFDDGSALNDQISSFVLYNQSSCPLPPDLVVQSITASPTNPSINQPVTFTIRIKNQGSSDVTSSFYVDFYIDRQPVANCSDTGTNYWSVNSLTAGATQDLTFTYSGFSTSGPHDLYAFADTNCYINENNETNNILGPIVINIQNTSTGGGPNTVGVFRPSNGALYLKNSNTTGFADLVLTYGLPGDYPIVGDWDGDGTDTIGIYRNGTFYLRNSNTNGYADIVVTFGASGDQPVAGDWNGDGIDTIGVYRSSIGMFFLRNSNSAGAPDITFSLGIAGDVGIAGDWNGDGLDTTGVFRPSNGALYLKNTNATGFADIVLTYGLPGDKPVTGDWDNDGIDTIGVYRNGVFYLRNSNTNGFADIYLFLGVNGDMPISGDWNGIP